MNTMYYTRITRVYNILYLCLYYLIYINCIVLEFMFVINLCVPIYIEYKFKVCDKKLFIFNKRIN